jgi:hypothetical protein
MANAPSTTHVFSRGSNVLDYWLTRAEGFTVQPLGARVEEVVVAHPSGRAEALIVRSRRTGRRRAIEAAAVAAVDPARQELELTTPRSADRLRLAAVRGAHAAANGVRTTTRRSAAATSSGATWLRPHVVAGARATARGAVLAAALTIAGVAWLAPRAIAVGVRAVREARAFAARQREAIGTRWPPPPEPPNAEASTRISQAPERNAQKKLGSTQPNSPV